MTGTELTDKLLATSVTRGEILRRIGAIRDFLEQKFFKPNPITLADYVKIRNVDGDPAILMGLGDDFYASFTRENVYQTLETISKTVNSLPTIILYLPFMPSGEEMLKLSDWVRKIIAAGVLVEIKQAAVTGGCVVVNDGIWRDYTLRY
jgi:hypothetical protein